MTRAIRVRLAQLESAWMLPESEGSATRTFILSCLESNGLDPDSQPRLTAQDQGWADQFWATLSEGVERRPGEPVVRTQALRAKLETI